MIAFTAILLAFVAASNSGIEPAPALQDVPILPGGTVAFSTVTEDDVIGRQDPKLFRVIDLTTSQRSTSSRLASEEASYLLAHGWTHPELCCSTANGNPRPIRGPLPAQIPQQQLVTLGSPGRSRYAAIMPGSSATQIRPARTDSCVLDQTAKTLIAQRRPVIVITVASADHPPLVLNPDAH